MRSAPAGAARAGSGCIPAEARRARSGSNKPRGLLRESSRGTRYAARSRSQTRTDAAAEVALEAMAGGVAQAAVAGATLEAEAGDEATAARPR